MKPMAQAKIEEQLLKIKKEGEEREAQRRAQKSGFTYLNLAISPIEIDALNLVPEEEARRLGVAPLEFKKPDLALAISDPDSSETKEFIQKLEGQGYKLKVFVASLSGLEHAWSFYKFVPKEAPKITGRVDIKTAKLEELSQRLTDLKSIREEISSFLVSGAETGELLEIIFGGALAARASDIHFEPEETKIKLRFRIDGLLHDISDDTPLEVYPLLVSRVKLFASLKINVQNEPQDGRFTINLEKYEIESRISIIPAEYGETIVIRILDPRIIQVELKDLGLRKDDLTIVEKELKEPNGMVLNTGPTGAGKTTTLYAFLRFVKKPEIKIITIEDPIEYHLDGIEQTQVEPGTGYTFVKGLSSIMRQDPDIILVGEIRDQETVGIALQAALTGHLVFSTVHANSAAGAVPRLLDLGARPQSIGPALNLVIAQRLVRRLCDNCKMPQPITPDLKNKIKKFLTNLPERVDLSDFEEIKIFIHRGCSQCHNLGYKGRVGIFELLEVGDEMENLITQNASEPVIHEFAIKQGMTTLWQDGILKVISGVTSFEEVEKATGPLKF